MIIFIIPIYIDMYGDCCLVYDSKDGEKLYYKKIEYVVQELYQHTMVDYINLKNKSCLFLNQKHLIPLYFSDCEILLPLKVRNSYSYNDSCYGYVNHYAISKIADNHMLLLKNGTTLSYLDNTRTIKKRRKMALRLTEMPLPEIFHKPKQNIINVYILSPDNNGPNIIQ